MKRIAATIDKETLKGLAEDITGLAAICFLCFAGFSLPGLV